MTSALIFDMDGVLFDSEPLHIRAWQAFLTPRGLNFPTVWFLPWVGVPDSHLAEHLRTAHGLALTASEALEGKRAVYHALAARELRAFPGVTEGLAELRARRVAFALATSSTRADVRHVLACTGLSEWFPIQVTREDVARHKPAPDVFLKTAELMRASPRECLVLEDSVSGIAAARAAGCAVVAIASSQPPESLAAADRVFLTTAEALQALRESPGSAALAQGIRGSKCQTR